MWYHICVNFLQLLYFLFSLSLFPSWKSVSHLGWKASVIEFLAPITCLSFYYNILAFVLPNILHSILGIVTLRRTIEKYTSQKFFILIGRSEASIHLNSQTHLASILY